LLQAKGLLVGKKEGKVKLERYCVAEGDSKYHCKSCNYEWDKDQAIDKAYRRIREIKASFGDFFWSSYLLRSLKMLKGNIDVCI